MSTLPPASPLSVHDLVRALGGTTQVAQLLNVRPSAVSNWQARGTVPQRHRFTLWQMAKARNLAWQPPGTEGMTLAPAGVPPLNRAA
jgi:hypothetical protein